MLYRCEIFRQLYASKNQSENIIKILKCQEELNQKKPCVTMNTNTNPIVHYGLLFKDENSYCSVQSEGKFSTANTAVCLERSWEEVER